jgi:predicted nucleotidyltransferase
MAERPPATSTVSSPPAGSLLAHVRAHREEIQAAAARYGATNLRLFGSAVRGEERPDSDVDLLADLPEQPGLLDIARLELELEDLLGRNVDLVEPDYLHPYIKQPVLAEAQPL